MSTYEDLILTINLANKENELMRILLSDEFITAKLCRASVANCWAHESEQFKMGKITLGDDRPPNQHVSVEQWPAHDNDKSICEHSICSCRSSESFTISSHIKNEIPVSTNIPERRCDTTISIRALSIGPSFRFQTKYIKLMHKFHICYDHMDLLAAERNTSYIVPNNDGNILKVGSKINNNLLLQLDYAIDTSKREYKSTVQFFYQTKIAYDADGIFKLLTALTVAIDGIVELKTCNFIMSPPSEFTNKTTEMNIMFSAIENLTKAYRHISSYIWFVKQTAAVKSETCAPIRKSCRNIYIGS